MELPLHPEAVSQAVKGDADLFHRLRRGDPSAFTTLVRRWEDSTYTIAYRITGDHSAAEDVRQAVFLRLLLKSSTIRRAESLGRWLRRSVVNEAINTVRRRKRILLNINWEVEESGLSSLENPEERLQAEEQAVQLRESLQRLDPGDRALLCLRFDEGLTMKEIAAVVEKPVSTVKTRVDRAVTRLRRFLKKNWH